MIYVTLPTTNDERRLTYYLAMEEYIARHLDDNDYFFMWQVRPTVIFGRNQLIDNEVNLEYCRQHNINTYRRKSGGGCVYADMNNIMFSYITHDTDVSFTFGKYIKMVVGVLRKLGIDATASGRNDIMIGNKKVSGNAFYHIPGRSIVHGTMLYDTDMENMIGAITPSDSKLVSKGIQSVRQHITLIKDHVNISLYDFKTFVKKNLCTKEILLDEDAMAEISHMEEEYLTPQFIYGNNPRYNITRERRIENVGDFIINIEIKNDIVKDIDIKGDFFLVGDIGKEIITPLIGKTFTYEDIYNALPSHIDNIILNLSKKDFVDVLTK